MNRHPVRRLVDRVHGEEGQSIITLALAMLFFIALLAVVGDTALAYMQRRDLQNTADAAALAAAQELTGLAPCPDAAVTDAAIAWAEKNIDDLSETPVVEILDDCTKVRVRVRKPSGSLFGGAIGFGEQERQARAAARIASVNAVSPCVVPLGVQETQYDAAKAAYEAGNELLVELKLSNDDTSNTGLLNLEPGNSAVPIAYGSCGTLTPEVDTKPGLTLGDVNNGMEDRLEAAITADCYEQPDVSEGSLDWPRCRPSLWTTGDVQATAVMLLPILATDITVPGTQNIPLADTSGALHLLAYFWIDGNATYEDPLNNKWKCIDHDCIIKGKFLFDVPVVLDTFNQDQCPPEPEPCIIDFDPEALIRVVLLDE